MEHEPRRSPKVFEDLWKRVGMRDATLREPLSVVRNLEGDWEVRRLSGPLPMPFVWKQIRGGRGETRVSPRSLRVRDLPFEPKLPFRLEQREGHVTLIYRSPLSFMVDELRLEADGSWIGRAYVAGLQYAWFRMVAARGS